MGTVTVVLFMVGIVSLVLHKFIAAAADEDRRRRVAEMERWAKENIPRIRAQLHERDRQAMERWLEDRP